MTKETLQMTQPDSDPFGLRGFDFSGRIPERSEMFDEEEARTYINGCDYPETVDDLLLALEMKKFFGPVEFRRMRILDAMCGPGRLGRELLILGAQHVIFHDGDETMIAHATKQALTILKPGQSIASVQSDVSNIPLPDNHLDLVVSHNPTHQLSDLDRLSTVMREFLRITKSGRYVMIADYQRATTPDFFRALGERLEETRPEIVPLLIPSFTAAFSKEEFSDVLGSTLGIKRWSVTDAQPPVLSRKLRARVDADFVKGHLMDFSPISQRVIVQKG